MLDADSNEIRIIDEIAPCWGQVAIALEVDELYIKILKRDFSNNARLACYRMLLYWRDSQRIVSWGFLIDALSRADYKLLAKRIEAAKGIVMDLDFAPQRQPSPSRSSPLLRESEPTSDVAAGYCSSSLHEEMPPRLGSSRENRSNSTASKSDFRKCSCPPSRKWVCKIQSVKTSNL